MKKCLKCNKVFLDDSLYCPECGELLISDDSCPSCHKEVKPDDKYCRYCGTKINRIHVCSQCGKQLEGDESFCSKCGTKLEGPGFILNKKHRSKGDDGDSNTKKESIINYILYGVIAVVAILLVIGMFGDIVTASTGKIKNSQTISYFFGEGARNLETIKSAYKYPEYYNFVFSIFVIENILYFVGLVGLISSIGYACFAIYKSFKEKTRMKSSPIIFMAISVLPYVAVVGINSLISLKGMDGLISVSSVFGWGPTLLIVGTMIGLASISFLDVYDNRSDIRKIISSIAINAAGILSAIILVCGLAHAVCVSTKYTANNSSIEVGGFYLLSNIIQPFSQGTIEELPDGFGLLLTGYALSFVAIVSLVSQVFFTFKKRKISSAVFALLSLVLCIVSSSLQIMGENRIMEDLATQRTYLGSGPICSFILSGFIIIFIIISLALDGAKRKEE